MRHKSTFVIIIQLCHLIIESDMNFNNETWILWLVFTTWIFDGSNNATLIFILHPIFFFFFFHFMGSSLPYNIVITPTLLIKSLSGVWLHWIMFFFFRLSMSMFKCFCCVCVRASCYPRDFGPLDMLWH